MRGWPVAMVEGLALGVARPAIFWEGEFADGWLRLWSGLGEIVWGGRTWIGAGTLVGIGSIEETLEVVAAGSSVTLSAVPPEVMQLALAQARQGAPGRTYLGLVNPPQRNFARGASAVGDASIWPLSATVAGVTMTRIGNGVEDGLPFVDLRYAGTPTSSAVVAGIATTVAQVMPAPGRWTQSARVRRIAGSLPAGRFHMRLTQLPSTVSVSAQTDSDDWQTYTVSRDTSAGTGVRAQLGLTGQTVGVPIDVTYRVAGLQLEPGGQRTEFQPYGAALWSQLVSDPVLLFGGRLDVPSWERGETGTIQITYESRLADLLTPRELRYTHESHQILYPGDRAFEYVTSIQDKVPSWGS